MNENILAYYRAGREAQLSGLKDFLRIPSISASDDSRKDVEAAAHFVAAELTKIGLDHVAVLPGEGKEHPLVVADWLHAPGKPTLMLYAHFDVQPADPVEKWTTPPFDPTIVGGKLVGRGSADDKGQLWIWIEMLRGFFAVDGKLPVNVKILFEGDEECGSEHITRFVHSNPQWFADVTTAVVLDSDMFKPGVPAITTGLRGIAFFTLDVYGCQSDQHSGVEGGVAPNAAHGMAKILSALTTPTGRIAIPGIYKGVIRPSSLELRSWGELGIDAEAHRKELGVRTLIGDRRLSVLRRQWSMPSLDVNGIVSGSPDTVKTVIPSHAHAKFSIRLVPGMYPASVANAVHQFIAKVTPPYVRSELTLIHGAPAVLVDATTPAVQAAAKALGTTFNHPTVYVRSGGSIPFVADLSGVVKDILITGFIHPDCALHAPNENLDIESFHLGIEAMARYFSALGE